MFKTIGNFRINVWQGGHPVLCELEYENTQFKFTHHELSDLKHAIEEMIKVARSTLPDSYKHEV